MSEQVNNNNKNEEELTKKKKCWCLQCFSFIPFSQNDNNIW